MPSKNHFHIRTADEVVDTSVDIEVDVGTAADVEAVMRKYDRESNTRTWEGTPGIVVRVIMVIFSLYCIWSTLFSVAAIEKRLTAFIACVIIMGYMTYPASKHHVRHNYIPWFDYVLMIVGAASFFYYCFTYDSLVMVLTSASKITPFQIAVGIIGILCLMELCRRCVGVPILCVAAALIIYTFAIGTPLKRVLYTLFYTTSGVMGTPIQVCASTSLCSSSSARSLSAPVSRLSLLTLQTPSSAASPAARPRSRSSPPLCAAWSPAPLSAIPSPPAPSPSR